VFVAADDQTVVVTVLPQVMQDMRVPITELDTASWTITAYLLGYVVAMPLIGRLSDVWGHRRMFILSSLLFMAGSSAAALSPNMPTLITMRVVQALGAGALVPISIAITGDLFPPGKRGLALGLIGGAAEAGGVIGPLWGGLVVRYLDWRWVFWMNIPLMAAVLLGLVLLLTRSPTFKAKVDYLGGTLVAVALAALTLGLARVDEPDALMGLYLAASVAALAALVMRHRMVQESLFPHGMFTAWAVKAANATHLLVGGALIIGMVTIPFMADTVMGLPPLEGGLRLMRMTAAIPFGAVLGGLACQRMDYRIPTVAGLLLAALGFGLMATWDLAIADPVLTVHLALAGFGFGLLIAPIALAATEPVGEASRGTAAGVVTAMRMVGMTFGLAALTAWGAGRFAMLAGGVPLPLPVVGETEAESVARLADYQAQVTDIGMSLFIQFFIIAMVVSLIALLPAIFMAWDHKRHSKESSTR
jgi:MFS family permease